MKARYCKREGFVIPFKGRVGGTVQKMKDFGHSIRELKEGPNGQQLCSFSLEPGCEAAASGKSGRGKKICPFALEAVDAPALSYCMVGK